jgi:hypothetical protein
LYHLLDHIEPFRVYFNFFRFLIVPVSNRGDPRKPSPACLSFESPFRVFGQIEDKLVGHPGFHGKQESGIRELVFPFVRNDFGYPSPLEHILEGSGIHGIPGKAVELPTQNPFYTQRELVSRFFPKGL